ncbi:MAG: hypothetical protein ACRC62_25000 [Microcoleus sp.]
MKNSAGSRKKKGCQPSTLNPQLRRRKKEEGRRKKEEKRASKLLGDLDFAFN